MTERDNVVNIKDYQSEEVILAGLRNANKQQIESIKEDITKIEGELDD